MVEVYNLFEISKWLVSENSNILLPAMQRGFVWKPVQIERVWDSILSGYPIGAFMLSETENQTMWLFDGQQRSTSIALALYNPWEEERKSIGNAHQLPVVWIDLKPEKYSYGQKFVIRVVTQSHPWGYQLFNNNAILSVSDRVKALDYLISENEEDGKQKKKYIDLKPEERYPYDSYLPIPLSFALAPFEGNQDISYEDWKAIICKKVATHFPLGLNTKYIKAEDYREKLNNNDYKDIYNAIKNNAIKLMVPGIIVKKGVLSLDDKNNEGDDPTLFVRINSEGTRLEGEELIYSIYKSTCPETKSLVESLSQNIISPAKTIVLASKLVYAKVNNGNYVKNIGVRQFQNFINNPDFKEQLLKNYIGGEKEDGRIKKLYDIAVEILQMNGKIPNVVVRQVIATKTEMFLLLLRYLDEYLVKDLSLDSALKTAICSQIYRTAWFGDVSTYVNEKWSSVTSDDFWYKQVNDGRFIQYPLIEPELLMKFFEKKIEDKDNDYSLSAENDPEIWKYWECRIGASEINKEQLNSKISDSWWGFINSVQYNRLLVLIAQSSYIRDEFPEFNELERLEDTNTPWDWDHIYPSEWVYGQRKIHELTRKWNNTIGNLRAMSLSDNRSESNKLSPSDRLKDVSTHKNYFIEEGDLEYWKTLTERFNKDDESMVINHAMAIARRLVNIYKCFYHLIYN